MKSFFRVLVLAVAAAAFHYLIIGVLMTAGVGPIGRGFQLLASGAMSSYNEAASRAWFESAEQGVMLDRYVLWPATFLLASILGVRFVPRPEWWHSIVLACAVLPLSVPSAIELTGLHLPGTSAMTWWIQKACELLAYALLVGVFSYLLRKLKPREQETNGTV